MSKPGGVYEKFKVERTDGRSEPGEKHHGCTYFVLDLNHDKHAIPALRAYAKSCAKEYPELAADLKRALAAFTGPAATVEALISLRGKL